MSLEPLSPNNNNTKSIVVDIQENFEGLDRVKGDDIRTARQRALVPNSLLGDFLWGFISQPLPTILGEKIQDRRGLYIQQTKAKKSPK
ncbi:hypothetical protein UQ52_03265 [Rickettsia conorii subsp. raoultii]|uniref:Uncharacterized protein n=1 Tax=Rickettsia conorii subsp. raoultii TaxID=369822 RepID=A0A9N7BGR9_RICCR|nr:hypothetical protein [Rickettsia conorii]AJQ51805.1 hypothetical protein UQ52_03265 [Rickettsia conorii subsp. raoultii]